MILYYRLKRQKAAAEEKSSSMKGLASSTLEEMTKMNIKGEHASPQSKQLSPKKYLVR